MTIDEQQQPAITPLLDLRDLAAYLRVAPATIRGWRTARTGPPALRVAGSVRWRLPDVNQWLEAQREGSEPR